MQYGRIISDEQLQAYGLITSNEQLQAYGRITSNELRKMSGGIGGSQQVGVGKTLIASSLT